METKVVSPPAKSAESAVAPAPAQGPGSDVVAPPVAAPPTEEKDNKTSRSNGAKGNLAADSAKSAGPVKSDARTGSSTRLAVTATVIIVLGLAALATFAYLKTNS